ncbi:MAG: zinc-binding dehydrogenase [Naasia sp.]|nr:zinc-binding dehydrogenase [Naasia sp.]
MPRVVRFPRFGGPEVLEIADEPSPEPGPGQVRVAVRAAGLNPVDYKRRRGGSAYGVTLPGRIGRELAGVVDAVGPDVDALQVGEEVFGSVPDGALADYVVAGETMLAVKPAPIPWPVAGGLALAGQTAWDALESQGLRAGDVIVVSAAAGGVGSLLCQLALSRGIHVIGSASAGNADWLRSVGVHPVPYGHELPARVRELAPSGVTAAFDLHGDESIQQFLDLGIPPERINTNAGDAERFGVRRAGRGAPDLGTLGTLAAFAEIGALRVPVTAIFPLDQVADAYRRLEEGHLRGKVVVVP